MTRLGSSLMSFLSSFWNIIIVHMSSSFIKSSSSTSRVSSCTRQPLLGLWMLLSIVIILVRYYADAADTSVIPILCFLWLAGGSWHPTGWRLHCFVDVMVIVVVHHRKCACCRCYKFLLPWWFHTIIWHIAISLCSLNATILANILIIDWMNGVVIKIVVVVEAIGVVVVITVVGLLWHHMDVVVWIVVAVRNGCCDPEHLLLILLWLWLIRLSCLQKLLSYYWLLSLITKFHSASSASP